ncbi:MAG: hypothetical protein J0H17_13845 [Rhizobiales bacterium]|nr:hypothetical protein [Hyphomicrobiales bacterium]
MIASLVVAFLEGECDMTTLPTFAKREVARHNRLYRDMGAVSLDGFVRGTDNLRLIDTIAADAMHF